MSSAADAARNLLRARLTKALKERDVVLIAALRSLIAAIDDAESWGIPAPRAGAIEVSASGIGMADVPRRSLEAGEVAAILAAEISERDAASEVLERSGRLKEAAQLRSVNDTLAGLCHNVIQ